MDYLTAFQDHRIIQNYLNYIYHVKGYNYLISVLISGPRIVIHNINSYAQKSTY